MNQKEKAKPLRSMIRIVLKEIAQEKRRAERARWWPAKVTAGGAR